MQAMAQALRTILVTAIWYGGLAALLIFVVAPWLHTSLGFPLQDNVTMPQYQRRALVCAAIGYPLICAVLIAASTSQRKKSLPERRPMPPVSR